jgi:hypothetical protein
MSDKPTLTLTPSVLRLNAQSGSDGVFLDVANPHSTSSVLYKCKTTSPQRYIVRNRQGVIAPGGSSKVHISLQRGSVLTGSEESDIFLVEARYLQPGESDKATAANADIGELMKAHGKAVIAKQQVSCELSVAGESSTKKPIDAQSTHTQPTAVSHKRDPLRRDAAAANAASAAEGAADAHPAAAGDTPSRQPTAVAAAESTTAQDPLRQTPQPQPEVATSQQARQRQPNVANPAAAVSRPSAASPRTGTAAAAKKKSNPLVIVGAVVTVALAGAYALGLGGHSSSSSGNAKAIVPTDIEPVNGQN